VFVSHPPDVEKPPRAAGYGTAQFSQFLKIKTTLNAYESSKDSTVFTYMRKSLAASAEINPLLKI
jgi:hypothetical protein